MSRWSSVTNLVRGAGVARPTDRVTPHSGIEECHEPRGQPLSCSASSDPLSHADSLDTAIRVLRASIGLVRSVLTAMALTWQYDLRPQPDGQIAQHHIAAMGANDRTRNGQAKPQASGLAAARLLNAHERVPSDQRQLGDSSVVTSHVDTVVDLLSGIDSDAAATGSDMFALTAAATPVSTKTRDIAKWPSLVWIPAGEETEHRFARYRSKVTRTRENSLLPA
jgi:hypothetical protein